MPFRFAMFQPRPRQGTRVGARLTWYQDKKICIHTCIQGDNHYIPNLNMRFLLGGRGKISMQFHHESRELFNRPLGVCVKIIDIDAKCTLTGVT